MPTRDAAIHDNITVNIAVGWGAAADGSPTGANALSEGSSYASTISYSQLDAGSCWAVCLSLRNYLRREAIMSHFLAKILLPFDGIVTVRQTILLALLYDSPADDRTNQALAKAINVSGSAITYTVDKLELHGLARRRTDTKDSRSMTIELTAKGRLLLEGASV